MLQQHEPQRPDQGRTEALAAAGAPPHHETLRCDERASRTLDHSLLAPAQARAFVAQRLCRHHDLMAGAAVALVASELVTDAVRGAEGPVTVALQCHVTSVTLSVTRSTVAGEGSSELRLADPVADMIVARICRASGTLASDRGLTMWCTIPTGFLPTQRTGSRASS